MVRRSIAKTPVFVPYSDRGTATKVVKAQISEELSALPDKLPNIRAGCNKGLVLGQMAVLRSHERVLVLVPVAGPGFHGMHLLLS